MAKVFFVSGTDTDAGKTYVACALLAAAKSAGMSTAAVKPVAAGGVQTPVGLCNDDALALLEYCTTNLSYQQINPVIFKQAIAPHIAAAQQNQEVKVTQLRDSCQEVMALAADLTLIEGAGGWKVPLSKQEFFADLVIALNIPVVLVVAMRLGCINHALLTEQAMRADGVEVAGWIANQISAEMPAYEANLDTLRQHLQSPFLGEIDYQEAVLSVPTCPQQAVLARLLSL